MRERKTRTARGERTKRKIKGANRKVDQATVWTPEMEYNNNIIARIFQGGPSRFRN